MEEDNSLEVEDYAVKGQRAKSESEIDELRELWTLGEDALWEVEVSEPR